MTENLPLTQLVLRLALAVLFGAALGLERELMRKPAGLRTHMMVSLGAAAFTIVTLEIFVSVMGVMQETRSDPIRIVEGIIGGIGFLGAGTIIRARGSVEGITTAASIWVAGAIGLACGAGYAMLALMVLLFSIVVVSGVGRLEDRLFGTRRLRNRGENDREES